jgi:hypothetical protein
MIAEPVFNYRGEYDENLPLPDRLTLAQYSHVFFRPDAHFVDGQILARNLGDRIHSTMVGALIGGLHPACKAPATTESNINTPATLAHVWTDSAFAIGHLQKHVKKSVLKSSSSTLFASRKPPHGPPKSLIQLFHVEQLSKFARNYREIPSKGELAVA